MDKSKKQTGYQTEKIIQTVKKDDVRNPEEYLKITDHMRVTAQGLLIPEQKLCGFCGKEILKFSITQVYFQETFHQKCVLEMTRGNQ